MKHLALALSAILLLTLTGWGEQLAPGEQARASVAGHRQEARDNARRHHHHRSRRHHRRHQGA
jgi:hypothetical protein